MAFLFVIVLRQSGGGGVRCGAGASESLNKTERDSGFSLQAFVSKLPSSLEPASMRLQ